MNAEGRKQKVFLSHSGKLSKDLAEVFRDFLRKVLLPMEPFLSSASILIGSRWAPELESKLTQAEYGIFFITQANAHTSNWMLYEAGAIAALNNSRNRVVPILVDIPPEEVPRVYDAFQWMCFDEDSCRQLVAQLNNECSDSDPAARDVIYDHFTQEWPKLRDQWHKILALDLEERLRAEKEERQANLSGGEVQKLLLNSIAQARSGILFDDDKFYNWTYAFHNLIHIAREVCVKMMSSHARNDDLPDPDTPGLVPPPHPGMERFSIPIRDMLDNIRQLFDKLPETSQCNIRVCLRDLRRDDNFHTFARSVPHHLRNPNYDNNSVPIPKESFAFQQLKETWTQAKCVIETTPQKGWGCDSGTHPNDAFYETKSVLIGSVIAKNVKKNGIISNAYTIWAIFVSSDKEGVFKPYHHAILQTCNDAFSCMANLMLRIDSCPQPIDPRNIQARPEHSIDRN